MILGCLRRVLKHKSSQAAGDRLMLRRASGIETLKKAVR